MAHTLEIVGSCAFKGRPAKDGTAEIAYFTYPDFEGQGYATSMARKLVEMAQASGEIKRVIAHTLPGSKASGRVLEKAGLQFAGEIEDPEDGTVWRWQLSSSEA